LRSPTRCGVIPSRELVTCSADGLSVIGRVDCTTSAQVCFNRQCQSLVCQPSAFFCENNNVRLCAANGLSSSPYRTCSASQYCDAATGLCPARLCTPGQLGCDGTRIATCNALGSGFINHGTDCSTLTGSQCSAGTCICMTGRADCDTSPGCEVNVSTSVTHCGGSAGTGATWYTNADLLRVFANSAKWATRCF
jgi:hypothetical protein